MPGRLSNLPVMCKSLKSYDVSFICDHSISNIKICNPIMSQNAQIDVYIFIFMKAINTLKATLLAMVFDENHVFDGSCL